MARGHVPNAGEIVWLQFSSQAGRVQCGHRPALVSSPAGFNGKTGMMVRCPMTRQVDGYPFEVRAPGRAPSAVLADQIKRLDWRTKRPTQGPRRPGRARRSTRKGSSADRRMNPPLEHVAAGRSRRGGRRADAGRVPGSALRTNARGTARLTRFVSRD